MALFFILHSYICHLEATLFICVFLFSFSVSLPAINLWSKVSTSFQYFSSGDGSTVMQYINLDSMRVFTTQISPANDSFLFDHVLIVSFIFSRMGM